MQPRDLSTLGEYRPGRGVEEVAREQGRDPEAFTVLSSNENAHGPSPKAVEAIRSAADRAHRYPKASHVDLLEALADHWDVAPERLWLGAGGVGALDYLVRATLEPGDAVLVSHPGFPYHGRTARLHGGEVRRYELPRTRGFDLAAEDVLASYDGERVVFLTSPHNPTGRPVEPEVVEAVARETDDETLVVVDEAYGEFSEAPSAVALVDERDDVAVMRTLSKAFGLAGLRVGYALVPGAWADAYSRVTTPFAASELACRAGLAALEDDAHVERSVETARWARAYYHEQLDAPTWASEANFVLAEVGDASSVASALEERGVVVRDCTGFGLPDCIRVTTGTREETVDAVDVINAVVDGV